MVVVVFVLFSLFVIGICLKHKAWIISAPMFVGLLYLFWLSPQLYALSASSVQLIQMSEKYLVMSILCLLASLIGWVLARPKTNRFPDQEHDRHQWHGVVTATIVLTIFSALLAIALESVRAEVAGVQQWTGRATIVNYFASVRILPLALSTILFFRRRTKLTSALFAANLIIVLPIALLHLRRSELIDIVVILFGGFWFVRNRLPKLSLILPTAAFTVVMVFIVGDLRKNASVMRIYQQQTISVFNPALWEGINLLSVLETRVAEAPDLRNGIYIIDHVSKNQSYRMGAELWNSFVFQYVPAQIVGSDLKRDLMFGQFGAIYSELEATGAFLYLIGTTPTGIGSAFLDFGYLGAIYFLLVAFMLGRLFRAAMSGDIWYQSLYLSIVPLMLISITHGYPSFVVSAPLFLIFWSLFRSLARYRFVLKKTI